MQTLARSHASTFTRRHKNKHQTCIKFIMMRSPNKSWKWKNLHPDGSKLTAKSYLLHRRHVLAPQIGTIARFSEVYQVINLTFPSISRVLHQQFREISRVFFISTDEWRDVFHVHQAIRTIADVKSSWTPFNHHPNVTTKVGSKTSLYVALTPLFSLPHYISPSPTQIRGWP